MLTFLLLCWVTMKPGVPIAIATLDCSQVGAIDDPIIAELADKHPGAMFKLWEIDVGLRGLDTIEREVVVARPTPRPAGKLLGTGPVEIPLPMIATPIPSR